MKNLPTILILALAFIHGSNAGKISGSMDSTEDESANGPGDGLMPIPVDLASLPINITINQQMADEGVVSNLSSVDLGKISASRCLKDFVTFP